jgi:sugar phosphate permease
MCLNGFFQSTGWPGVMELLGIGLVKGREDC